MEIIAILGYCLTLMKFYIVLVLFSKFLNVLEYFELIN